MYYTAVLCMLRKMLACCNCKRHLYLPNCTNENLEQFTMRWVGVLAGSFIVGFKLVAGLVDVGFVT